ncbi:OTU domain-containing protein 7B [Biomphalaria glabrata]|nr:OTU domain-containing protein 7B [Biomphalaria glabrata]
MDELKLQESQKIEELMRNTCVTAPQAKDILIRNRWSMSESYREIEQMCRASAQHNNRLRQTNYNYGQNSPPYHRAIEMGVGRAVNLPQAPPPYNSLQFSPAPHTTTSQHSALSVQLPEQFLPIHIEGGRTISVSQTQFEQMKPPRTSVVTPPTYRPSSQCYGIQDRPPSGNIYQPQKNKPEPLQKQKMEIPVVHKDDSHLEDDDIFDERIIPIQQTFNTYPRLKRGFSNILENESLVSEARHRVQSDILKDNHDNMYVQTFVLPDMTIYPDDFRAFLEKDLIETSTLVSLEQAGRLNWWAELRLCQRLLPMATSGDGNCLLHAASLAMWGIHDRQLILRKELHDTLTTAPYKDALYRRWRYQQTLSNKQSGLVFNEEEWQEEWNNILRLASPQPRSAPDPMRFNNCCDSPVTQGKCDEPVVYESLEEFHVFVLAHVLQRPIIVVADAILKDSNGDALAPIPFPGIYLPLEVAGYYKSPLLLTYDAAHFSALSPMEQNPNVLPVLPAAIPLVDPELKLLPLHFYKDPGPRVDWSKELVDEPNIEHKLNLLHRFLDVDKLAIRLTEINGDSDRGSCGSQDSDENTSLFKEKKDKKKEARMSQTVAKQFGSIGKSMGKKLKQLGKTGKSEKSRQTISGDVVQNARVISNYNNQRNCVEYILVAKLSEKRTKQQQALIDNYLVSAKERFEDERELKRKSDTELRGKGAQYPPTTNCHTPGCPLYNTAQSDFICSKCKAARHSEPDTEERNRSHSVYNTYPGRGKQSPLSDEIYIYGKSKFYTSSNESSLHQVSEHLDPQSYYSNRAPRTRSPSPDYDNFPTRKPVSSLQSQCKTPNCNFYGSHECNGFCSKCFKNNKEETKLVQAITKL